MAIVSLSSIIEAAAERALLRSEVLTLARKGRSSGQWYYMYCREMELFELHCILSGRGL